MAVKQFTAAPRVPGPPPPPPPDDQWQTLADRLFQSRTALTFDSLKLATKSPSITKTPFATPVSQPRVSVADALANPLFGSPVLSGGFFRAPEPVSSLDQAFLSGTTPSPPQDVLVSRYSAPTATQARSAPHPKTITKPPVARGFDDAYKNAAWQRDILAHGIRPGVILASTLSHPLWADVDAQALVERGWYRIDPVTGNLHRVPFTKPTDDSSGGGSRRRKASAQSFGTSFGTGDQSTNRVTAWRF